MLFYQYKSIDCSMDLDTIETVVVNRIKQYSLPPDLQHDTDTEEFNYSDRVSHLFLCLIAIDYPYFKDSFMNGEIRLFHRRLKTLTEAELTKEFLETSEYLTELLQSEELVKLKSLSPDQILLVRNIIETFQTRSEHSFSKSHSVNCRRYKLTLPFTFPLKLVAKREVEVKKGKVSLFCGEWSKLFELIFEFLLKIEFTLISKCDELKKIIYNAEDDRLRRIIKRCTRVISGRLGKGKGILRAKKVDKNSMYFPPCMAGLHQVLRSTHRLSYTSRYQYSLFLKDIGMPVDENIAFWKNEYEKPVKGSSCTHSWQEKEKRYTYQIEHMYGLKGSHSNKSSHSCGTFIQELHSRMDGGCPFQHLTPEELRKALPKSVLSLPDVEDIFTCKSNGLPQKACARYLNCLHKVLRKRKHAHLEAQSNRKFISVVSPLQFYRLAKSRKF